jgi:hypothetical protein
MRFRCARPPLVALPLSLCICLLAAAQAAALGQHCRQESGCLLSSQAHALPPAPSPSPSSLDPDSLLSAGRVWDVPMPTLHEKMFRLQPRDQQQQQHQTHSNSMIPLPAFAYISSSNSGVKKDLRCGICVNRSAAAAAAAVVVDDNNNDNYNCYIGDGEYVTMLFLIDTNHLRHSPITKATLMICQLQANGIRARSPLFHGLKRDVLA